MSAPGGQTDVLLADISRHVGEFQRRRVSPICTSMSTRFRPKLCALGGFDAKRRSSARRTSLRRSRQAQQGSRAIHLSVDRPRSVRRHPERRIATGRGALCRLSRIHEGRTMSLLGKLDWSAIPFMSRSSWARWFAWPLSSWRLWHGSPQRDTGRIFGANGSHLSIISVSASCIWRSRWSCWCAASRTQS